MKAEILGGVARWSTGVVLMERSHLIILGGLFYIKFIKDVLMSEWPPSFDAKLNESDEISA